MIGRLKGVLIEKQPPLLLIDVHGVGYEVLAPMTSFYHLPDIGSEAILHTHLAVSETAQQLYGFYALEARSLFRQLIKVNGVGPKMALAILSGMDAQEFTRCVMENNVAALVKVPGVGKKTAERLVIEMRDRVKDLPYDGSSSNLEDIQTKRVTASPTNTILAEAESALVALGYKPTEAAKAVSAALDECNERNSQDQQNDQVIQDQVIQKVTRSEDLIRMALRGMMPK